MVDAAGVSGPWRQVQVEGSKVWRELLVSCARTELYTPADTWACVNQHGSFGGLYGRPADGVLYGNLPYW